MQRFRSNAAFTLIELLIVVAIIAILAAIAVPNFLEAQTRSKVSRVKADMRSLATALEAYSVDNNRYPPSGYSFWAAGAFTNADPRFNHYNTMLGAAEFLTTPIAYFTSIPQSPFIAKAGSIDTTVADNFSFAYTEHRPGDNGWSLNDWNDDPNGASYGFHSSTIWYMLDPGPDLYYFFVNDPQNTGGISLPYDPTNGTVSTGDIVRFGP